MASQSTNTVGQTPTRRKVRRRRMTGGARPGAARGMDGGTIGTGAVQAGVNYDALSAHIRGTVDGFALANNITSQQAFTGLKKHLVW
jgi:hypothetical protein